MGGWLGIPFRSSAVSTLSACNIKDYFFIRKRHNLKMSFAASVFVAL